MQVRKAVGLGRMALDPLAVISTLLGRRKELLSLQLHDLQAKLPQELLASRLEQVRCCAIRLLCQCVVGRIYMSYAVHAATAANVIHVV